MALERMHSANPDPAPMAAHVEQTVRSITLLHAKHHQEASQARRSVDRLTAFVFLGLVCAAVVLWTIQNSTTFLLELPSLDPPPFAWLELAAPVTALVVAVLILVIPKKCRPTRRRQRQMTLELASFTEQKVAKIIELVEELRRDSPEAFNRVDSEAHEMSIRADPHAVLGAIKKTLDSEMHADGVPKSSAPSS